MDGALYIRRKGPAACLLGLRLGASDRSIAQHWCDHIGLRFVGQSFCIQFFLGGGDANLFPVFMALRPGDLLSFVGLLALGCDFALGQFQFVGR